MSSVTNVHLGPSKITYGSDVLGWTDEKGAEIEIAAHKIIPLTVSEYGVMPIGGFDVGIESVKVKFEMYENSHANRKLVMPFATDLDGHTMTEGGTAPGTEITSLCKTLNFHPYILADANKSLDFDIHLILLQWKGAYKLDVEGIQVLQIEGEAIADLTKSANNKFYSIGGASS